MGKKAFSVIALEVRPECLKFVEMARGERRVLSAGIFPLAPGRGRDQEHLAAQIRSALDTTARAQAREVIASVALGDAWLRAVRVPRDADARGHAAWDMERYLGERLEHYLLDVIPEPSRGDDEEGRGVLVAAVKRSDAVALRDALESATGLGLAALDVDAAALVNVFAFNYPEHAANRAVLIQADRSAVTLVRTRAGRFEGAVVRRDAAALTAFPAREADASDAPRAHAERDEALLRAARAIADSLRNAPDGWDKPAHILLCGDLCADAGFRELLRAHSPEPFTLFNPFRNIAGPDPAEYPDVYPGGTLAAAVGLALRLTEDSR